MKVKNSESYQKILKSDNQYSKFLKRNEIETKKESDQLKNSLKRNLKDLQTNYTNKSQNREKKFYSYLDNLMKKNRNQTEQLKKDHGVNLATEKKRFAELNNQIQSQYESDLKKYEHEFRMKTGDGRFNKVNGDELEDLAMAYEVKLSNALYKKDSQLQKNEQLHKTKTDELNKQLELKLNQLEKRNKEIIKNQKKSLMNELTLMDEKYFKDAEEVKMRFNKKLSDVYVDQSKTLENKKLNFIKENREYFREN